MTGPLSAVRRLTSAATGLATSTVRTGAAVASTAVHGALHLVRRDGPATAASPAREQAPEPVRVPTPPDPAVRLAKQQAEKSAATTTRSPERAPAKKAPSKKAPAKQAPAKRTAGSKAAASKATSKPAPPKKKASEVPLKSDPTPASAAPPEPEGPDVLPGGGGATGLAEAEPLLDPAVAAQVRSESEQLRSAAE